MAERIVRRQARIIPSSLGQQESAGQDPVSVGEEESLASLAALSGLPLNNRTVTNYIQSFTNATLAQVTR